MKSTLRNLGAVAAGVVAGVVGVSLVQSLSNALYAPPESVDINEPEQLAQWIRGLPTAAFLIVLASWGVGCFLAGGVARWLATDRILWPGLVAVAFPFLATMATLSMLPHPIWMWPGGMVVCLLGGYVGMRCAAGSKPTLDAPHVADEAT
ncbi:MAG: hypothetical protein AAGD07_07390 [Planctomycetota bacterium]